MPRNPNAPSEESTLDPVPEQLNAELAAAHAEQAAEDAAAAERELAEASKSDPHARLCPHCNGEMVRHEGDTPKAGAWHCSNCGGCWVSSGGHWRPRDGHPAPADWSAT